MTVLYYFSSRTRPEFQKLFIQLTGCMEMLVQEMGKSLALLAAFPIMHSGRYIPLSYPQVVSRIPIGQEPPSTDRVNPVSYPLALRVHALCTVTHLVRL